MSDDAPKSPTTPDTPTPPKKAKLGPFSKIKRQNTEEFYERPAFKDYLDFDAIQHLRTVSTTSSVRTIQPPVSLVREQLDLTRPQQEIADLRRHGIMAATLSPQVQQTGSLLRHLQVRPGESGFLLWYSVSNSFPILAASLGPISNLNSIAALADPWRVNTVDNSRPSDFKWMLALNAISLFLGCVANISLFLNFSGRVNYVHAQLLSICGWYTAWALLVTLLISAHYLYFQDPVMSQSEGYWQAVFTAVLYFISATLLFMNWFGHRKGRYPASFNLTTQQRRIMLNNVLLIVWIGLGGILFSFLIDIRFTDGIYYCVVTVTTIGLGDIVPTTNLGRALVLPYALVGVIYLGLIVTTITSLVLHSNGEAMVFDRSERARIRVYERLIQQQQEEDPISPKESFLLIHKIHRSARRRRKLRALYTSITAFSLFWLLGAMTFHFTESWSYFDALYFVSLCLLTIGYGDFTPTTAAGRAFFIMWALGAVPMMTILISNLSDNLFQWINDIGDVATAWLLAAYSVRMQYYTFWKLRFRKMAGFMNWNARHDLSMEDLEVEEERQEEDAEEQEAEDEIRNLDDNSTSLSAIPSIRDEEAAIIAERAHDGKFTVHESEGSTDSTSSSVQPTPKELFRKKLVASLGPNQTRKRRANLQVANLAERMLGIVKEIRMLAIIAAQNPNKTFSYDDWQRISKVVAGGDLDQMGSDFWLSDRSPVRFPVPEVRYFMQECLEGIEVGIYDMVDLLAEQDSRGRTGVPSSTAGDLNQINPAAESSDSDKGAPPRTTSLHWGEEPKRDKSK